MKQAVLLGIGLLIIFTPSSTLIPQSGPSHNQELHERCIYPTVMISGIQNSNCGSGVILRSDKVKEGLYCNVVLTASHVIINRRCKASYFVYKNWSTLLDIKESICYVYAKDDNLDMAILLFLSDKKLHVAQIGKTDLYIGNEVYGVGCGLGNSPRVDWGKINRLPCDDGSNNLLKKISFPRMIRTSINTVPGDSGGPAFYDNKLIGIKKAIKTESKLSGGQRVYSISFIVPIEMLEVLNRNVNQAIDFAIDNTKSIPVLPVFFLEMEDSYISN